MKKSSTYLLSISTVSAMGGLLFGYDFVVIGGAKPFYELYFGIADLPVMQGWAMGSAILGCLLGVTIAGALADRYGRRPLLTAAAAIFIAASAGTGAANELWLFIAYRILGGVGIGIASNLSPMYIAEVSPAEVRGRFVSINQLTIVLGILAAQTANWLIADPVVAGDDILLSWNGQTGWRVMFWACALPAALFFALVFFIPESPRWLAGKRGYDRAEAVFLRIGGADYARREMQGLLASEDKKIERAGVRTLFRGKLPRILMIGTVIAVFQQWCGINVIFNYAHEVFAAAGYGVSDMLFNIVVTGLTNVAFTFVGMYAVDRLGRRRLLMAGACGLAGIYSALGACYYMEVSGLAVLVLVVSAIACYAMTLAPVTWVVISEIFPTRVRGLAMATATFALWAACFALTYTFPILNDALGSYGTFWLYGLICAAGFVFIKRILPETKGESLESIEKKLCNKD
ncbi:MAG: sugar porter family MFS transporter [Prevotellaceae bacterium]|jgi:SP family sugar porter-like MFS transporter|nr:sugar porter family MFS transporter [Prevotellaceae bacterium]